MSRLVERPIKDYCLGIYDGPHATPSEAADGPVFLGIKNITDFGSIDLSEIRHVSEEEFPRWTRRVTPQPGDVVFTYEATLHRYAVIPEGFRGCLGRRVALVRPNPAKVDSRYLLYYFLSHRWRRVIESNVLTGATVDRVPLERFPAFPVAFPRLPVQQRTAEILSAYDELMENNRRRMVLLENAARQLYSEWFVRLRFPGHEHTPVEDGVPDGWQRTDLGKLLTLKRGYDLPTGDRMPGDVPIVSSSGITGVHNEKKASAPGVVTGRYGTIGEVYFRQQDFWPLNTALYVSDFKGNPPVFIAHLLKVVLGGVQSEKAAVPGVNRNVLHRLPVLSPTKRLIDAFAEFAQLSCQQIHLLETTNCRLRAARDLLLPRLMAAEIAV
jgi:type I restriction enzyme, S subunit